MAIDDIDDPEDEVILDEPQRPARTTYSVGGVQISLPSDLSDEQRKTAISNFITSEAFRPNIDVETGAKAGIRASVGSAPEEDRLATIRQYYPDALPYLEDNFIFTNPETKKITLYNPEGFDIGGDIASVSREIVQTVGGTLGAVAGTGAGPVGTAVGAGYGTVAAGELFDAGMSFFGERVDTRDFIERSRDVAFDFFISAAGQRVGEAVGVGLKKAIGGGKVTAQQLVDKFRRLRIEPPAGAASGSHTIALLEKGISASPFSASVMQKNAELVIGQTQQAARNLVRKFGTPVTPQRVGEVVRTASEKAAQQFQTKQNAIYEKAYDMIGKDAPIALDNIIALRQEFEQTLAQAPKSLAPTYKKVIRYLKNIQTDAGDPDGMPLEVLRTLRTDLGKNLAQPMLVGGKGGENAAYKQVYAAMTLDLSAAAQRINPKAANVLKRADQYTKAFNRNVGVTLNKIGKFNTDEEVFRYIEQGRNIGATKLRQLRKQFEPEEWDTVVASTLDRMGLASAGGQDATGELFSVNTFMSNWNRMSAEAKDALFYSQRYKGLRQNLDDLVEVSSSLKGVERFANTSNSGNLLSVTNTIQMLGSGLAGFAAGGGTVSLFGIGAVAGLNRLGAVLITNPKFVKWLITPIPNPAGIPAHLGRLYALSIEEPDLREPIQQYLQNLSATERSIEEGELVQ